MHAKVINQPDYNEYIIFYLSNIYVSIFDYKFDFLIYFQKKSYLRLVRLQYKMYYY